MNNRLLTKIAAILLALVIGGVAIHAPISVFVESRFPELELIAKSWKEIVLGVVLGLEVLLVTRRRQWRSVTDDVVVRLIAAYAFLHVLLTVFSGGTRLSILAGIVIDLRYVLIFALIWVLLKIAPEYKKWISYTAIVGAVIVVGFGVLQLFLPADSLKHIGYSDQTIKPYLTVDDNPDFVRINSTLRGPNPLGAYLVIALSVMVALAIKKRPSLSRRQWLVGAASGLATLAVLWVSYSRSALIGAFLALAVVVAFGLRLPRKYLAIGVLTVAIAVAGIFLARENQYIANVVFHDDPVTGPARTSDIAHADSLRDGTERLIRQPLGAGVGSTGSASIIGAKPVVIENQYLFIAHESGWLGLGLFLAIFGLVMKRLYLLRNRGFLTLAVFGSGLGLAAIGLIQPVWIDETVALTWWGLAAIALGGVQSKYYGRQSTKQKTT